jgi:hypothetical protein
MQTERGRWFLEEYAKRNRSADTHLLLAAIERIETVVCAERNRQAQQGFRSDLLEMAKAINRTRAEVAEISSDAASRLESAQPDGEASPAPRLAQSGDIFAAAERIRDVTWAMRGHGFDPSTCDQLEELAASILSANSLRDPADHRASKLVEVLQYLERRIDTLLLSSADGDTLGPEPAGEPEHDAFEPALTGKKGAGEKGSGNGFARAFVTQDAAAAGTVPPLSPPTEPHSYPVSAHDDLDGDAAAESPALTAEAPQPEVSLASPPGARAQDLASAAIDHSNVPLPGSGAPTAEAEPGHPPDPGADNSPEQPISTPNHEVAGQIAGDVAPSDQSLPSCAEPTPTVPPLPATESSQSPHPGAENAPEQSISTRNHEAGGQIAGDAVPSDPPLPAGDQAEFAADAEPTVESPEALLVPGAGPETFQVPELGTDPAQSRDERGPTRMPQNTFRGALLPTVELPSQLTPRSSAARAAAALREAAARARLPEIDLRSGADAAPARGVPAAATMPSRGIAAPTESARPSTGMATIGAGRSDVLEMAKPTGSEPAPDSAARVEPTLSLTAPPLAAAVPAEPTAPMPRPVLGDPLATLKALSDDELIALFS